MIESQTAFDIRKIFRVRFVFDLDRRVQDGKDTLGACQRLLHAFQQVRETCDRGVEEAQIQQERDDYFYLKTFAVRQVTTEGYDQDRAQGGNEFYGRMEDRADL